MTLHGSRLLVVLVLSLHWTATLAFKKDASSLFFGPTPTTTVDDDDNSDGNDGDGNLSISVNIFNNTILDRTDDVANNDDDTDDNNNDDATDDNNNNNDDGDNDDDNNSITATDVPTLSPSAPDDTTDIPTLSPSVSDPPSFVPSDVPSMFPSGMPSQYPSPVPTTTTEGLEAKFHYGNVYYDNEEVAFTCGGMPLTLNQTTAKIEYTIPYSYAVTFDSDVLAEQNDLTWFLEHTIHTLQLMILDQTLYTTCSLKGVLFSDRETVSLATLETDTPVSKCGTYCFVLEGYVASFMEDPLGLLRCQAMTAVENLLESRRMQDMPGVVTVNSQSGASSSSSEVLDGMICLPAVLEAPGSVEAMDEFHVDSFYTCRGTESTLQSEASSSTTTEVDFVYSFTVDNEKVNVENVQQMIEETLFRSILEFSCYVAAAVQKDNVLTVSSSPEDVISGSCGDNCYEMEAAVTFEYPDEYRHLDCAVIKMLAGAFSGDSILALPGVLSASFGSDDLLYSCMRNALEDDPDYNPASSFSAESASEWNGESQDDRTVGATALIVIGGLVAVAIVLIVAKFAWYQKGQSPSSTFAPMEPDEECTPRKLFQEGQHQEASAESIVGENDSQSVHNDQLVSQSDSPSMYHDNLVSQNDSLSIYHDESIDQQQEHEQEDVADLLGVDGVSFL